MLCIALCIVLFFDLLIALLVPSTETMIFATDGTAARYATDFVALLIGLFALYKFGWKKAPSVWMLAFLLFMLVSHFHAVNIHFAGEFIPNDMAIYDYKPMFECLIFFSMFMGLYSMEIRDNQVASIKATLVWAAVIYGAYAILQRFGVDQFYKIADPVNIVHMSRNPQVGGFISQPVFCAALLTMLFAFVLADNNLWKIAVVIAGIIATGNRTSLIGIAIVILYYFEFKGAAKFILWSFIAYLTLGTVFYFMNIHVAHFGEERFRIWHDIIADFSNSKCPGINNSHILTGIGIGAFPVIFPYYYTGWFQAHNEYLEALKGLGLIGFIIMMRFICLIPTKDKTIMAALFASFVLALTNATWHIPQLAFLTVLFVALLYKTGEENARPTVS